MPRNLHDMPILGQAASSSLLDSVTTGFLVIVLAVLAVGYAVGRVLKRQPDSIVNPAVVETFLNRIRGWIMIYAVLGASLLLPYGRIPTVVLFGLISFWALREYITLTPTRLGDHRALFWIFFVFTPVHFILVGIGQRFYPLYSILIPVYAFLFIPARVALAGDYKRFLERTAKIQAGLMVCVYAFSHAPALLDLQLRTSEGVAWSRSTAGTLFFLILVVNLNDIAEFAWGRLLGNRVIAPGINSSRTWEGFFGGLLTTSLLGTLLWWITPFSPLEAACMAMICAIMGSAGSLTMSAIKRDRGVKDYGTLVEGHVGVLDRIDSICFAAPVFFHLTRTFFA